MFRMVSLLLRALFRTVIARSRRGPLKPTWTFRFEWIIDFMRLDWRDLWRKPPAFIRRQTERLALWPKDVHPVTRTPVDAGGVPGVWFDAPGADAGAALLYFHGGSYQFGSTRTHGGLIARLAQRAGVRTLAIDYRLVPEHPRPAQLEDALRAYRWLLAQGFAPARISLAGDSAGGHLVLAVCAALPAEGLPLPGACVLFSPWLDLTSARASMSSNAAFDYGTREMLQAQGKTFAGELSPADPRVSPIVAEVPRLPPTLLVVGTCELLLDECKEYAERAVAAGRPLTLDLLEDMPHNGQLFPDESAAGRGGLERSALFLRTHTAPTSPYLG